MTKNTKYKYLVWRDMDYEGWYSEEFVTLKEARDSVKRKPQGDKQDAIITKII